MSKPSSDRRSATRSSAGPSAARGSHRPGNRTVETPPPRPRGRSEVQAAPELTNRQRSILRGLGHHLHPIVQVGKEGISEGLLAAIATAMEQHELIKLRLLESVPGDRFELAAELAKECRAALVQVIGRNVLLYRPRPATDPRPSLEMEL